MKSVILHVAEDTDVADSLCDMFGRNRAAAVTLVAARVDFSADSDLVLIWSARAERAGPDMAAIARRHGGTVTLCQIDATPVPPMLAASCDGRLNGRAFARASHWRLPSEHSEAEAAREPARQHGFAGGFVRGFVGTVSVLGFCGALAVGMSHPTAVADAADDLDGSNFIDAAAAAAVSYDASAVDLDFASNLDLTEEGLLSDADLRGLGAALLREEASEHADVQARLDAVRAEIQSLEAVAPIRDAAALVEEVRSYASMAPMAEDAQQSAALAPAMTLAEAAVADALAQTLAMPQDSEGGALLAHVGSQPDAAQREILSYRVAEQDAETPGQDLWTPSAS
jgi:hypothetical protein